MKIFWSKTIYHFIEDNKFLFRASSLQRFPTEICVELSYAAKFCSTCYYSCCFVMYRFQLLFAICRCIVPNYITVFKEGSDERNVNFFESIPVNFKVQYT